MTSYLYDSQGMVKEIATPKPPSGVYQQFFTYSPRGDLLTTTGPISGQTVTHTYENSGLIQTTTDPLGRTTTYGYDGNGRRTSTSDLADADTPRTTTTTFNARDQVIATLDARGNPSTSAYSAWGERTTFINRRNQTYAFTYYANGLPRTRQTPLGHTQSWTYNDRNLPLTSVQPSGTTTTTTYDLADRLSTSTDPVGTVTIGYDANDNPLTVTEGSAVLTRTFDPSNRVKTYTDANGNLISYRYYANGLLKTLTYPGPRTVTYTYDPQNRLTQVQDWANRLTTFQWRADGLLQQITRPNGSTRALLYDVAGQLLKIEERDPAGTLQTFFHYNYDLGGRVTSRLELPPLQGAAPVPAPLTYDPDNRLTRYNDIACTVDDDGNLTTGPLPSGVPGSYVYDARNRLTSAGDITYTYDAENHRVAQTTAGQTTRYVIDPQGSSLPRVLIRTRPDTSQTYYIYAGGTLLYEEQLPLAATAGTVGAVTYYHYDQIGSTVALTNSAGAIIDRIEYTPYGGITHRQATFDTPFLYGGAQGVLTDDNGLVYMRARYYHPRIARFLNADPIGFAGGSNWYAYCGNNPISRTDASGLWFGIDDAIFSGVGAAVGVAGKFVANVVTGNEHHWEDYTGAAIGGAAGGEALLYTANPFIAGAVGGAAGNFATQKINQATGRQTTDFNYGSFVADTAIGTATGFIPGAKIPGISAGRGSSAAVFEQIVTKAGNGTIDNITNQTANKMVTGAFVKYAVAEGAVLGSEVSNIYSNWTSQAPAQQSRK